MTQATIRITGMRFEGRHGANPGERDAPQFIEVDVEIVTDARASSVSDDVADTLDYDTIFTACEKVVTKRSFNLLEALAAACLDAITVDPRALRACVRIRKPALLDGATPEVEITRER